MAISRQDVEHVAYLARLGMDENEKAQLQQQLSNILQTMRVLDQLDTRQIPPTAQVIPVRGVMREDEVRPSWPVEQILQNAPARDGDFFLVPPVLEE
jgi:aspartyl-tRNA(Asn)/glutamyl-tRNA(Gln) amidotransferase subunit C